MLDSVESVLKEQPENKKKPVIINYGLLHDFSDEFSNYNFYTVPHACSLHPSAVASDIVMMQFASQRYVEETNEDNKDVLYQFLYEKWNQISEYQKEGLRNSVTIDNLLISYFERIRRIINKETLSDEESFEFIFNYSISEETPGLYPKGEATQILNLLKHLEDGTIPEDTGDLFKLSIKHRKREIFMEGLPALLPAWNKPGMSEEGGGQPTHPPSRKYD